VLFNVGVFVVDVGSVLPMLAAVELTLTDDIALGELGMFIPEDVEVELDFVVVVVTVVVVVVVVGIVGLLGVELVLSRHIEYMNKYFLTPRIFPQVGPQPCDVMPRTDMTDSQGTNLFKILYLDWQQKSVNIKA